MLVGLLWILASERLWSLYLITVTLWPVTLIARNWCNRTNITRFLSIKIFILAIFLTKELVNTFFNCYVFLIFVALLWFIQVCSLCIHTIFSSFIWMFILCCYWKSAFKVSCISLAVAINILMNISIHFPYAKSSIHCVN